MNPQEDAKNILGEGEEEFSTEILAPHAIELMERAQIDVQIATAKRYPRQPVAARKRMISIATMDKETAASCYYTLRRWDSEERKMKPISGPSIRLAEIAFSQWGNLRGGSRVVDNDGKVITSQGLCHDLETNVLYTVATQRRITNKKGEAYSQDMQVTTGNAANSIAFRNAVFKVVPQSVVQQVLAAAKAVAVGDAKTLKENRDKSIAWFISKGATLPRILASLEKVDVELIDLADLETLIGYGSAIKEKHMTIDEAFPPLENSKADQDKAKVDEIERLTKAGARVQHVSEIKPEGAGAAPKDPPAGTVNPAEGDKKGDDVSSERSPAADTAPAGATGAAASAPPARTFEEQPKHRQRIMTLIEEFSDPTPAWNILGQHGFDSESFWEMTQTQAEIVSADLNAALATTRKAPPGQPKLKF